MPNCWKKCCKFCDSFFKTSKQLAKHYRKEHLDKMFICHHCDKAFMSDNKRKAHELKYHQDEESDEEDEWECEDCDKVFSSDESANNHPCPIDEADEEVDAFKIAIESEMKEEAEKNKIAESELKEEPQQISVVLGVPQEDEEEDEKIDEDEEERKLYVLLRNINEARKQKRIFLKALSERIDKDHPLFLRLIKSGMIQRDEQRRLWKYGIKPKK